MQREVCGPARLKSAEVMGPFAVEAEGLPELLIHGLHNRAYARPPASPPLGPRHAAIALRRAEDLGTIGPPPKRGVCVPLEALVDDIGPTGRGAHACQSRLGMAAKGNKRRRQGLILGTGWTKAEAGDHAPWVDRQEHMAACIPAQPVAPAHVGQSWQPSGSSALGIPGGNAGAIEGFIGTARGGQKPDKMQTTCHEGRVLLADWPVERRPGGPRRKGGPEMTLGIALTAPLTAKTLPLPEQGQGHNLAPAQGGLGSGVGLGGQRGLEQVVCHNVKDGQEGVHIDPSMCS